MEQVFYQENIFQEFYMTKRLANQNIGFADSELKSFLFHDDNDLTISIESWDAKTITLKFRDVIYLRYRLDSIISNFYGSSEELGEEG
jgi:hypothetical protein